VQECVERPLSVYTATECDWVTTEKPQVTGAHAKAINQVELESLSFMYVATIKRASANFESASQFEQ
jgi:hypothetical protein